MHNKPVCGFECTCLQKCVYWRRAGNLLRRCTCYFRPVRVDEMVCKQNIWLSIFQHITGNYDSLWTQLQCPNTVLKSLLTLCYYFQEEDLTWAPLGAKDQDQVFIPSSLRAALPWCFAHGTSNSLISPQTESMGALRSMHYFTQYDNFLELKTICFANIVHSSLILPIVISSWT